MADYKAMYFRLFNSVTDAISILQEAQQQCEDRYVESDSANIMVLDGNQYE